MTLREQKKARTREALADAALRLYAEQGFEQTTVDQIAEAAEVARRTFFRYFPSKEAALFPDRERRLAAFRDALARRPGRPGRGGHRGGEAGVPDQGLEAIRQALLRLADDYVASRERVALQQRILAHTPALAAHDLELDREWEAAIAEALGDRPRAAAARRRRARLQAGAIMGAVRATLREWYAGGGRSDLREMGQRTFELLRDGLQADAPP
jgi:AcrR family transcriptional regulator